MRTPLYTWMNWLMVILLSSPLLSLYGQAQAPNFTKYLQRDGLMSSIVYDIQKDKTGFIWLATEDGLYKFDGNRFWSYRHEPGSATGLQVNFLSSLKTSREGTLWIGTSGGGLHYYNPLTNQIMPYRPNAKHPMPLAVTAIQEDKEGNIIITGFDGFEVINSQSKELITRTSFKSIASYLQNKITTASFQDSRGNYYIGTNEGIFKFNTRKEYAGSYAVGVTGNHPKGSFVNEITEDKNGTIWAGTENGLAKLTEKAGQTSTQDNILSTWGLGNRPIYAVSTDKNNRVWVGTSEGLIVFNQEKNELARYVPNARDAASISSASIRSILIDSLGAYWIGTFRGGLNKYDENLNLFSKIAYNPFDPLGIKSPKITAFAKVANQLFLGTDGGGLQIFDKTTRTAQTINLPINTTAADKPEVAIMYLYVDNARTLWIGTYSYGLFAYNPATRTFKHYKKGETTTDLNNDQIFAIKQDKNGNLWVGTNGGGINVIRPNENRVDKYMHNPLKIDDKTGPANNYIRAFTEDNTGKMWIGTFGAGVSVFDPSTGQFTHYTRENSTLSNNYIQDIEKDKLGNIYIGTSGDGMSVLKKGSDKFENISEKDGLPNGVINKILINEAGNIWLSTNNSIGFYNPTTREMNTYTAQNGLQEGAFLPRSGLLSAEGEIYFGGEAGFNYFNPSNLQKNKHIPQIVFTTLKVNNIIMQPGEDNSILKHALNYTEKITLKYNQTITIGFAALDFTNPANNKYLYKLEGFNTDWQPVSNELVASFANLPPGQYTFKIKASNNDGVWNENGRTLKISVTPPWWRSYLAYFLYILVIGGTLYFIRKNSIQKIRQQIAFDLEKQNIRKELEYERKQIEDLRKVDQMKIKFLTNISHEFKTPISLILGPIDSLISIVKDAEQQNKLQMVKRNSKRLLNLVNQLLDFRKLETGEVKLIEKEGELTSFIREIYESFLDLATNRQIDYSFDAKDENLFFYFDHQKLERILFNLLSNAFKFTKDKGSITLQINSVEFTTNKDYANISISVVDNGIGIPGDVQEKIFDNFFQHHGDNEILNQGSGIGLAITKEFVTLHQGEIHVESSPNAGSTFSFTLRLKAAPQLAAQKPNIVGSATIDAVHTAETTEGSKEIATQQKPLVLIVEDDHDFRKYLKEMLEPGYRTTEASNGKEGWQRALFNHPDLVLCDIQMPIMNGFELVNKIKTDKRTKHIPVILITAADTPQNQIDGLETGAIDYISKPFDISILKAKVQNILQLNQIFKDTYSRKLTISLPETEVQHENEVFMNKTVTYIYENLSNPQLSVELLSDYLKISRASLYNKVMEYTGMSPVDFIKSVKLEKAKDLLEKTDKTVADIAHETGFANPNYFTKVFKTKHGMTPSEYAIKMKSQS